MVLLLVNGGRGLEGRGFGCGRMVQGLWKNPRSKETASPSVMGGWKATADARTTTEYLCRKSRDGDLPYIPTYQTTAQTQSLIS